ncbi:MAG: DUF3131 domain-containing protein [Alphaproteobacteria bacterium]|nr:DUF3131 domain-containing protein [Alphaproteobacteria bacterium]MCD8525972.1 DUF3131 domain-containing protein [Alphaproteobacteria bacterium]
MHSDVTAAPVINQFAMSENSAQIIRGLSDEQLLDLVQRQTLRYFTDYAHPVSGMARERSNHSYEGGQHVVTVGGTGFGIMAMIAGAERGWITRVEFRERLGRIVNFLEQADTFHGAFPHWMDGRTGRIMPFSRHDDGGDLVETSFLMAGLLAAREYLSDHSPLEAELQQKITKLWEAVEWDWYTKGENRLYWHWSPNHDWQMSMPVSGWNEALITYVLAAASPTHPISAEVYHQGWARNGDMRNGRSYDGITLPLGMEKGGALFLAHYSFLGLDPRGLNDRYADYWQQNRNHTLINYAHALTNPHDYEGYGPQCWGFTASDNHRGYSAHAPTHDLGVITPTAALSSFPYTPEESMRALRHFYEDHGDKIWSAYGFVDAFNETEDWQASGHLAIDQGPIVVMIENHRSGLLWDLFMKSPDIHRALHNLGFQSPHLEGQQPDILEPELNPVP